MFNKETICTEEEGEVETHQEYGECIRLPCNLRTPVNLDNATVKLLSEQMADVITMKDDSVTKSINRHWRKLHKQGKVQLEFRPSKIIFKVMEE